MIMFWLGIFCAIILAPIYMWLAGPVGIFMFGIGIFAMIIGVYVELTK